MSEYAIDQRRRAPTRVRTLGDAVPVYRACATDSGKPGGEKTNGQIDKTISELFAERRDAAAMASLCAVDGCSWMWAGTAAECREAAAQHRADAHPELVGRRTFRKGRSTIGGKVSDGEIAEARRRRAEREEAERLEKVERGRARGALEEAASARGDVGAVSSSSTTLAAAHRGTPATASASTTTTGRAPMKQCKRPGCENDASDAPAMGPYAGKCAQHREEMRQQKSASTKAQNDRQGGSPSERGHVRKPRGSRAAKTQEPPAPADGGSLTELATELEAARADLEAATTRYAAAVCAFKAHDVIQSIANEKDIAA